MSKYLKILQDNFRRYAHDKSNYQISKLSGVSEATISALLNNNRNPTLDVIVKLSDAFGISPSDLLADPKDRPIPSDILLLLENQDDAVYDTIRTLFKAINLEKNKNRKVVS